MRDCELQVIGTGPAGIGLVLALCNRIAAADGAACPEQRLLDDSIFFEAADRPGGQMSDYRINANTSAHDVIEGIADGTPFTRVRDAYVALPETQQRLIALPRIGALLVEPLADALTGLLGDRLVTGTRIVRVALRPDGYHTFDARDRPLGRSRQLLFCCGGDDAILPELEPFAGCWEGSARFLMRANLDGLPQNRRPIVIVGGSHSAFSCAWRLLHDPLFAEFAAAREIVILHRREQFKLRCTPAFAREHRIEFDPASDVCPRTNTVFFNAGLRKDAKFLYLDIRDGRETRARLQPMGELSEQQDLLAGAGLILQGTGFAPRLPPVERDGHALRLGAPTAAGRLRDLDSGEIVPGCFGMGLGFNILPARRSAGEPSFAGGLHGLQSYPLAVAPPIIEQMLAAMPAAEPVH